MAETRRSVRLLALPLAGNRSRTSRGRCSYNTKAGRLCLSKTSKCLRERDLSFFIILSSDADFCHDTPRKSGFDLPLARYPRARELGFAPPNRCASAFCEKASEIDRRGPPAWVCLSRLWRDWRSALAIVKPETVVVWHRAGFRLFWTWKVRRGQPGRPLISREVRDLIRKMCRQNPSWGAPRIHGELLKLGIDIGESSVSKYMVRCRKPPRNVLASGLQGTRKDERGSNCAPDWI